MKVLVGKTFGIGNAVMAIPMIRAIKSIPDVERVDVLIGNLRDDVGAGDVLRRVPDIDHLYVNEAPKELVYDVAVMAIPFDGRWKNGVHYLANEVMDGRTRPDPSTTGLSSWKRHEVEYQMDNAYDLGYRGGVPRMDFMPDRIVFQDTVYLGVGYKKDTAGQWSVKHWGNDCFVEFTKKILSLTRCDVVSTGDMLDLQFVGKYLLRDIDDRCRFSFEVENVARSFERVAYADVYVGNDTGMMHVAAAHGVPCVVPFFMENSITKNRPWGDGHVCIDAVGRDKMSLVDEIVEHTLEKLG